MINKLQEVNNTYSLFDNDISGRRISVYKFHDVVFGNGTTHYPNVLFKTSLDNKIYSPINETIMSLKDIVTTNGEKVNFSDTNKTNQENLFFFVYNVDNYYHFLYDSLPYLITFLELRKQMNIKLLVNYPNKQSVKFYDFVLEFLQILDIHHDDIVFVSPDVKYKTLFVSDSYTHGEDSTKQPHSKIYDLYKKISNKCNVPSIKSKKLYVSRRTWKHNNLSNIGTDYTTRRLLVNETELVEYLQTLGFEEIFTELLTTEQKVVMFKFAEHVVGPIGGGLANVLFSENSCKLLPICSPGFLDVNTRFLYAFSNVDTHLYTNTFHTETTEYKKYMRVMYKDIVGEITNIDGNSLTISYLNDIVAGWNNSLKYDSITVDSKDCKRLDNGLNSQWKLNLEEFKTFMEKWL